MSWPLRGPSATWDSRSLGRLPSLSLPHPGAGGHVAGRYFMVGEVVAALGVRDSEGAKLSTEVLEGPDLESERCPASSYGSLATSHC